MILRLFAFILPPGAFLYQVQLLDVFVKIGVLPAGTVFDVAIYYRWGMHVCLRADYFKHDKLNHSLMEL